MGYRIVYDGREGKYEVRARSSLPGIVLGMGCCILLVICCLPGVAEKIRSVVIPGEDALTVAAFSAMQDDLRSGAGFWDAVEVFCRQVIHGK